MTANACTGQSCKRRGRRCRARKSTPGPAEPGPCAVRGLQARQVRRPQVNGLQRAQPRPRLPTSRGSIAYFSSRRLTAVSAMETTSSWSPQNAMRRWPRPLVYLPGAAPSKRSSSAWSTCRTAHPVLRTRRRGRLPLAHSPVAALSGRSRSARPTRVQRVLTFAPRPPAWRQRPASTHSSASERLGVIQCPDLSFFSHRSSSGKRPRERARLRDRAQGARASAWRQTRRARLRLDSAHFCSQGAHTPLKSRPPWRGCPRCAPERAIARD